MNIKNSGSVKKKFLIGAVLIFAIVALGIYYFPLKSIRNETIYDKSHIIFQGEKVSVGDTFNFSPDDSCVEDTEATLSAITDDGVTFRIKEWNWKNELNTSIEEVTDYTVGNKDCITARPRCTDVGYKYCFSLYTIDSVQNITYELESYSTMPKPKFSIL